MEADLQRYYTVDFRDLFRPTTVLTWRRLKVLLNGLPPESLWCTQLRREAPPEVVVSDDISGMRWSTIHDLLASLIDATNAVQWTLVKVNSTKAPPPLQPFPRPGSKTRRRGMSAKARARIAELRNNPRRRDGR